MKEASIRVGGGVGPAIEVRVGDELSDAVEGESDDLEEARGGEGHEEEKDGLGVGEGEVGAGVVMEGAGEGAGVRGG